MLSIEGLIVRYGDLEALHEVNLTVDDGDFVALLGRNGAGKSSIVRAVTGLVHPTMGSISYHGTRLDKAQPGSIVRAGIAAVLEGRQLFDNLSVADNLRLGAYGTAPRRWLAWVRSTDWAIEKRLEEVFGLLPELRRLAAQMAGTLSGGQQQMVAVGRALMADPTLLLVDELSLGLAPLIVERLIDYLHRLNAQGTAIVLVEQNIGVALSAARYAYLLESGEVRYHGLAAELANRSEVLDAYLDAYA